ncbi:MAG: hypothetical protein ACLFWL_15965 [Candidatus Brocadiia bacterium]
MNESRGRNEVDKSPCLEAEKCARRSAKRDAAAISLLGQQNDEIASSI